MSANSDKRHIANISKALIMSSQQGTALTTNEEEITRKYYMDIINSECDFESKKRRMLEGLGTELLGLLGSTDGMKREVTYTVVSDMINDEPSVESTMDSILTCGRWKDNDIIIDSVCISRIQFIMFHLGDQILILDTWSLNGTSAESDDVKLSTTIGDRRLLRFRDDEHIVITLPNWRYQIHLNLKPCIICMDRVRRVRLSCNHAVLCHECYTTMQDSDNKCCPICRKPLAVKSIGLYQYTCMHTPPRMVVTRGSVSDEGDSKRRRV